MSIFNTTAQHTDPFTLRYVAGHDNITQTTVRHVHPREDAVEKLFRRLGELVPETRVECKGSVKNSELPSGPILRKY